jgi:radical SAM protein with 4Fe4S-binding SPASM domain
MWFTTMRENVTELPDVARFAIEAGIPELYIQRLVYFGDGLAVEEQSLYRKLNEAANRALAETIALCEAHGVAVAASGGEKLQPDAHQTELSRNLDDEYPWQACTRPWRLMYVQANGDVSPCCFAPFTGKNGEPVLGNVFEQSVENIWHGEKYRKFRQAFLSGQPPQCCEGCGARWSV